VSGIVTTVSLHAAHDIIFADVATAGKAGLREFRNINVVAPPLAEPLSSALRLAGTAVKSPSIRLRAATVASLSVSIVFIFDLSHLLFSVSRFLAASLHTSALTAVPRLLLGKNSPSFAVDGDKLFKAQRKQGIISSAAYYGQTIH
jgi:hypothetical protein